MLWVAISDQGEGMIGIEGGVRLDALETLGKLTPATLARHADAVVARLEDDNHHARYAALRTLGKLGPAVLLQYADAVVGMIARIPFVFVLVYKETVLTVLRVLPHVITRDIDFESLESVDGRSRLLVLSRLRWYRCRLHLRVKWFALYWYALPYRPSGPGYARDVAAWDRMIME